MSTYTSSSAGKLAQLLTESKALLNPLPDQAKPVIAAWGLMNAGKSYLLNMLTAHYQHEYFATNDVRETTELKQFEGETALFLDTPGLDGGAADDAIALVGAAQADLVLFVHQAQGELDQLELDFLKQLARSFGSVAAQQIVLVISKADGHSKDQINLIEQKVLQQCQQTLGFQPVSFQISGTRYHKGICQQKSAMVQESQMLALQQHLADLQLDLQRVRGEKTQQAITQLLAKCTRLERQLSKEQQHLDETLHWGFAHFNDSMCDFDRSLMAQRAEYTKIKQQGV